MECPFCDRLAETAGDLAQHVFDCHQDEDVLGRKLVAHQRYDVLPGMKSHISCWCGRLFFGLHGSQSWMKHIKDSGGVIAHLLQLTLMREDHRA